MGLELKVTFIWSKTLKFDKYKNKILPIGTKTSFTDTQEQLFSKPH